MVPVGSVFPGLDEDGTPASSDYYPPLTRDGAAGAPGTDRVDATRPTPARCGWADEPRWSPALATRTSGMSPAVPPPLIANSTTIAPPSVDLLDRRWRDLALAGPRQLSLVCAETRRGHSSPTAPPWPWRPSNASTNHRRQRVAAGVFDSRLSAPSTRVPRPSSPTVTAVGGLEEFDLINR